MSKIHNGKKKTFLLSCTISSFKKNKGKTRKTIIDWLIDCFGLSEPPHFVVWGDNSWRLQPTSHHNTLVFKSATGLQIRWLGVRGSESVRRHVSLTHEQQPMRVQDTPRAGGASSAAWSTVAAAPAHQKQSIPVDTGNLVAPQRFNMI